MDSRHCKNEAELENKVQQGDVDMYGLNWCGVWSFDSVVKYALQDACTSNPHLTHLGT